MQMRTVRASAKGQFTIPKDLFDAMGDPRDLLLIQDGMRLVVLPAQESARALVDDLGGWEALAAPAFADVWDNEADEVWDHA